jgi:hypothetical protein
VAASLAGVVSALILSAAPIFAGIPGAFGAFARIMADSVLVGILYCAAVALLHGGVTPLLQFKGLLLEMMPWRKSRRTVSAVGVAVAEAKAATT